MAPTTEEPAKSSVVPHEEYIRKILHEHFDRNVLELKPLGGGTNGVLFKLSIDSATASKPQTTQPGVSAALPDGAISVVMRMSDPTSMLNEEVRVQNEVATMMFVRDALASLDTPLVPNVYGWGKASGWTDYAAGDDYVPGWVLLELMPGETLAGPFDSLEEEKQRDVLRQMAVMFRNIQSYKLPESVKGFGGLNFDDAGSVVVGPTAIAAGGPCATHQQLYEEYYQTQLRFADKCDIVKGWRDSDLRIRIDKFAAEGLTPLLKSIWKSAPKQTLVHGDFDIHNILFDRTTNRITALLDYDFASVASQGDEYFYSFAQVGGLLTGPEEPMLTLRDRLLHGFHKDDANTTSEMVNWKLAVMLDEEFAKAGLQRPQDIDGIDQLSTLYWFINNISPGLFFLKRFRDRAKPEQIEGVKQETLEGLERDLKAWGY